MNIYCWAEYAYYDGMWTFAKLVGSLDPDSPITSVRVTWLNSEWSEVQVRGHD